MPKHAFAYVAVFLLALSALGRFSGLFPFKPPRPLWTLQNDYAGNRIPTPGTVRQLRCARSSEGIVIGADGPGYVEWTFSRPGPFPTVVQPYLEPSAGRPVRVTVRTPAHPNPIVLYENMPLRNRPFDLWEVVRNERAYALRFEGDHALLESIRFVEPSERPPVPWAVAMVTAAILGVLIFQGNQNGLILLALGVFGFYLRWKMFCTHYSLPLEGDSAEYWSLGDALRWAHPWITGPRREPGFIWVVHASQQAFGASIRSVRFAGMVSSLFWVPLVVEVASAASWPIGVGLGAAALVATNPFAVFMSVQGYREEFYVLLMLLFSIAWLKNQFRTIGWIGGLLCVTRIQAFLAVIPLMLLCDWKRRWRRRQRLYAWAPFLLMSILYFRAVRSQTGSLTSHLNPFGDYVKTKLMKEDGTSHPLSNFARFLFTPAEFSHRMGALLNGYLRILLDPRDPYNRILLNSHYARPWNLFFLPFFWIGLWACAKGTHDRWFLWLPLLFLGVLPILHDVFSEPRLLFIVQPFMALLTARGVWFIARVGRVRD